MKAVYKVLSICLIGVGLVWAGCTFSPTAQPEANRSLVRRWFGKPSQDHWAVVDDCSL